MHHGLPHCLPPGWWLNLLCGSVFLPAPAVRQSLPLLARPGGSHRAATPETADA
ncbi:hypothetical protein D557_0129 [Bordetella holmesii 70147]|nr:hypothetical protein D557_0129 [Bordetella holmesii 70147]